MHILIFFHFYLAIGLSDKLLRIHCKMEEVQLVLAAENGSSAPSSLVT
jgi:hypothetical protein